MTADPRNAARAVAIARLLRGWALERYGSEGTREKMHETLGVPYYRPSTDTADNRDMMAYADYVRARARERNASLTDNKIRMGRTVLMAVKELTKPRNK